MKLTTGSSLSISTSMQSKIDTLLLSPAFMQQYDAGMHSLYGTGFDKSATAFISSIMQHYSTLLAMIYAFDDTTGEHLCHSEQIADHIANKMDLPPFDKFGLTLGAMLHDIGKVGIEHRIIVFPGALNATDRTAVENHVEIGRAMLTHLPTPWRLEDYAYMHHERLDGSGYPNGLKAEQLPRNIRIMAVVDVAESLLGDRPYRKPWTLTAVLDYLHARPHLFDTDIVKHLETLKLG